MNKSDVCIYCQGNEKIAYRPSGCRCVCVCVFCATPETLHQTRNGDVKFAGIAWQLWDLHRRKCGSECDCQTWPEPPFDTRGRCGLCRSRFDCFVAERRVSRRSSTKQLKRCCEWGKKGWEAYGTHTHTCHFYLIALYGHFLCSRISFNLCTNKFCNWSVFLHLLLTLLKGCYLLLILK